MVGELSSVMYIMREMCLIKSCYDKRFVERDLLIAYTWRIGTCNVALFAFRHARRLNTAPPTSWFDIQETGMQICNTCLANHGEGGATYLNGMSYSRASSKLLFERVLLMWTKTIAAYQDWASICGPMAPPLSS